MLTQDLRANFWNGMTWSERLEYIQHVEELFNVKIGHSNSEKTFRYIKNNHLLRALNSDANKEQLDTKKTEKRKRVGMTNVFLTESMIPKTGYSINQEIKKIIRDILKLDAGFEISDEAHILNEVGADSLDFVELIMEVEEKYDISISDHIAETLVKVNLLTNHVLTLLGIGENRERSWYSNFTERPVKLGYPG